MKLHVLILGSSLGYVTKLYVMIIILALSIIARNMMKFNSIEFLYFSPIQSFRMHKYFDKKSKRKENGIDFSLN